MDRYGGTQAMEVVPVAEWAAPGGETGLEEPMRKLCIGVGPESYPVRPSEPNCIYYLRTGFCGYGNRCRFNHPRDQSMTMAAFRAGDGEYPERVGQPVCQYYMRTGTCRFGTSCKFNHPKHGIGSSVPVTLNIYGYPLRLGEKECSYYVKTGHCKFGLICKFHHPQPAGVSVPAPVPVPVPAPGAGPLPSPVPTPAVYSSGLSLSVESSQQYGVIQGNWVARPAMLPGSYVPESYGPMLLPPSVVPITGWTPYPAPSSPVASQSTQPAVSGSLIYGITQPPPSVAGYTGPYLSIPSSVVPSSSTQEENAYPERPGQPECQYFLRTGVCKFGATCKYHHPLEWNVRKTTVVLSPMGLPLRPGTPLCSLYAQNGVCKFGPTCRFDHPMRTLNYSPSASSLTDMPVAPYPIGSTHPPALAPSPSSSNLRLSGSNEEAFSSSQISSMNSASVSVSPEAPTSEPGLQQSGQGSRKSLSWGSSMSQGGEVHSST